MTRITFRSQFRGPLLLSDISDLWRKYNSIVKRIDPERLPRQAFLATGAPIEAPTITSATIAHWSASASTYATQLGKVDEAKELVALGEQAANETELVNVKSEIATFYSTAFDLRNAEMNLEAIAKISERTITKDSKMIIESYIEKFDSLVEKAVVRAHGVFTDALMSLKEKLVELRGFVTQFAANLKDKFINAFNAVLEFFFRILSEFVSAMFSFVAMISKMAEPKGYTLKTVNISFDPPSIGSVTVLGAPVPFPKFSLPKVEIGFEAKKTEA